MELYSLSFWFLWLAVTRFHPSIGCCQNNQDAAYIPPIFFINFTGPSAVASRICELSFKILLIFWCYAEWKCLIPWEKDKMNIGGKLAVSATNHLILYSTPASESATCRRHGANEMENWRPQIAILYGMKELTVKKKSRQPPPHEKIVAKCLLVLHDSCRCLKIIL